MNIWLVKHIYDCGSSKPECSVEIFSDEKSARDYVKTKTRFEPTDDSDGEPYTWFDSENDEYLELEGPRSVD